MRLKFLIFLACLSLISGFANTARADPCPPPSCPACYTWNGSACVYICGCLPSPIGFSVWPSTNDRYVCIDDTIVFNAQWPLTYDGDGCSLIYIWNFGLGAYDIDLGVDGSYVSCRYGSAGDRTVKLTVTRVTSSDPNSCCHTPRTASFSRTVTVVKVASLLPDVGTEIDDGDSNPDTKSFAVCIVDPNYEPNFVTVTATPNPVVPEQCLPGYGYSWGWQLTGGKGTSRLFRTVDRTATGVTTITCVCGSSFKETKIYVVKVQITRPCDTNHNGKIDDEDNEFSFNSAEPAVLQFSCTAASTPLPNYLRWTINDIGAIRGKWNPHLDGDEYTGIGLNPTVTFTDMPANNSDFGPKTVTLRFEGLPCTDTEDIEVFFEPTARNNNGPQPDDIPPNIDLDEVEVELSQ